MKMILETPVKLILPEDGADVQSFLTFVDRSVDFLISKHRRNYRWATSSPESHAARLEQLKAERKKCLLFRDDNGRPWTYAGLWLDLQKRFHWEVESQIKFPEPKILPWKNPPAFESRYYQKESVEALVESRHGAIALSTGAGKTKVIVDLCKYFGQKTIVMTPSSSITDQIYREMLDRFGAKLVGKYGDGSHKTDKLFTVCTGQALTRLEPGSEAWDDLSKTSVFIADECFPYDAKIVTRNGAKRISHIFNDFQKGIKIEVLSYNELRKDFEFKSVTNAWRRDPKDKLVSVSMSNRRLVCTEDHKILTTAGWASAKDLKFGDLVIGSRGKGKKNSSATVFNEDQLQVVYGSYLGDGGISSHNFGRYRLHVVHGQDQKSYLEWINGIIGDYPLEFIEENGYSKRPAWRFTTKLFDSDIPYSMPKGLGLDKVLSRIDLRGLAVWYLDDGNNTLRSSGASGIRLHTESFSLSDQKLLAECIFRLTGVEPVIGMDSKEGEWCYYYLRLNTVESRRFLEAIAPFASNTMLYKFPEYLHSLVGTYKWNSRPEIFGTNLVTEVRIIDSINILSERQKLDFARNKYLMQLYDLEVEGNHNFVVGGADTGIVAHNCHVTPATTFEKVCMGVVANAPYRFFVSATQIRNDGSEMVLKGITGPIVYEKDFRELVKQGFLAEPIVKIFHVPCTPNPGHQDAQTETRNQLYMNPQVNSLAGQITEKAVKLANRQVLILIDEFDQFMQLRNYLSMGYEFAHGTPSKEAKEFLPEEYWNCDVEASVRRFNTGECRVLIGTSAISTGVDLKPVGCLIYLQGGTSEIKVKQSLGRGTRPCKKDFWYVDFKVMGSSTMERHLDTREKFYMEFTDKVAHYG